MDLLKISIVACVIPVVCLCTGHCLAEVHDEHAMTINITGDVLLDRGVKELIDVHGMSGVMGKVAPLFASSDYTIINLECPVTDIVAPKRKTYVFRSDPVLLQGLRSIGVSHANLANNHALDQGEAGFVDTIKNLTKAGISTVGVVRGREEVIEPEIIEKDGVKIAVFAANMVEIKSSENATNAQRPCEASSTIMLSAVSAFHHEHPEIHEIVFLHWGEEYSLFPTDNQASFAHNLIDAGVDAVLGCHPHVIQSVEVYHGRPIIYSLGNLLFDQSLPVTLNGLVVTFNFEKDCFQSATLHTIKQDNGAPQLEGKIKLDLEKDKMILPSELVP
jgi:poly-gamma-glutamate capsule biosynthesis protein CapA/YwtB (metallophosphatase superfamily)